MTEILQTQQPFEATPRPAALREQMSDEELLDHVHAAVQAADSKKALDITTLRLVDLTSFTDYFVICSGNSTRQVQAIADEITDQLRPRGMRPMNTEGYSTAEWILMDYGAFVVHVFTGNSRRFYDLERLWRDAERVDFPDSVIADSEISSD
jgi:ribosome-associated protein